MERYSTRCDELGSTKIPRKGGGAGVHFRYAHAASDLKHVVPGVISTQNR